MSENGVMNRGQIRKFEHHSQELISWMLKFNVTHEGRCLNDSINNIFTISCHEADMQQILEGCSG
jgi:hypothetical protein